jgi:hypothetical protein
MRPGGVLLVDVGCHHRNKFRLWRTGPNGSITFLHRWCGFGGADCSAERRPNESSIAPAEQQNLPHFRSFDLPHSHASLFINLGVRDRAPVDRRHPTRL